MNFLIFNRLESEKLRVFLIFVLFLFFLNGCAWMNPFADSVREYDLDGEHQVDIVMMPGESVAFDMRNPGSGGYEFSGATFNPDVLKLEYFRILKPDSGMAGDFGRWRLEFKALDVGDDVITIHIKRPFEEQRDPYKIIAVKVTTEGEPFFEW